MRSLPLSLSLFLPLSPLVSRASFANQDSGRFPRHVGSRASFLRHVGQPEVVESQMRCRELRAPASRDAPTATNESLFLSPASLLLFPSLSASSFRTSHRNFTSVAPENYRDITPAPRRCVETARRKRGQEAQGCVTTAADGTQDYSP